MKSGSSASIVSGAQTSDCAASSSSQSRSRGCVGSLGADVTQHQHVPDGLRVRAPSSAWSTLALSGMRLPPRTPSSAVMTTVEPQSAIRPASDSGENPPKTTEWIAPMRVQASMATAASGTIGM